MKRFYAYVKAGSSYIDVANSIDKALCLLLKHIVHLMQTCYDFIKVLEETGFDIANLIDKDEYIEYKMNEQLSRLYLVPGVSMDTKFQPRTRKEIKVCISLPYLD